MKKLVLALCLLAISACDRPQDSIKVSVSEGHSVTVITKSTINNGVKTSFNMKASDYYIKPSLGVNTATAAYMSLENLGDKDDALVSVSCDCAGSALIHQMSNDHGMMNMSELNALPLSAHQVTSLAPMGTHIMLMDTPKPLKSGDQVTLRLKFKSGFDMELNTRVQDKP